MGYEWKFFRAGGSEQVLLRRGADIAALAGLDRKRWLVLSLPTQGLRFDARFLALMDVDRDGRIRIDEVLGAIRFLQDRKVDLDALFAENEADRSALEELAVKRANIAELPLTADEEKARAAWEVTGETNAIRVLGARTAAAEATLAAVETVVDNYFAPAADMPLVTEEPAKRLPLEDHLNPKYAEAIHKLRTECIVPLLGERASLDYTEWQRLKAAFAPYRAHCAAKPVAHATLQARLDDEERVLRYKIFLLEFLKNFVNMERLYLSEQEALFQIGLLRLDAREFTLCFPVANEAAHSALAGRSKCCVLYLALARANENAVRTIGAVVTAGSTGRLYVGRKGVFLDRDGGEWEAVITKVVANQVSLAEAFWAPWKKIGDGIAALAAKFLGDKQTAAVASVTAGTQDAKMGGAAMASSVAAIGVGIGMAGAALASILAAVSQLKPWQIPVAVLVVILIVSLPSVILTAFKLRQRDLGAILNASGWAVNRPLFFSLAKARTFTRCAQSPLGSRLLWGLVAVLLLGGGAYYGCKRFLYAPVQSVERTPQATPAGAEKDASTVS